MQVYQPMVDGFARAFFVPREVPTTSLTKWGDGQVINMKEFFEQILKNITPPEVTAGDAIRSFVHRKNCRSFGKDFLDAADSLQIGSKESYGAGVSGGWGFTIGSRVNVTFIKCSDCDAQKVFQEMR